MGSALAQQSLIGLESYCNDDLARTAPRPQSQQRHALLSRYAHKLEVNPELARTLVSFQGNKDLPFYRWFKYKEAFSAGLVRYFLDRFSPKDVSVPHVLDPFAGIGTTLTVSAEAGCRATGIELLPVGVAAIQARLAADYVDIGRFTAECERLRTYDLRAHATPQFAFPHLRITEKAFPPDTEAALSGYNAFLAGIPEPEVRVLFRFAAMSALEEMSYTRKDGQYLRWDQRSGKSAKSRFYKGPVARFEQAIAGRLALMLDDLQKRNGGTLHDSISVVEGSCLEKLPSVPDQSVHLVITSPPYCNRYDYTRTYALELAYCGLDESRVKRLRQTMLSCTVENRPKRYQLAHDYRSRGQEEFYRKATSAFETQAALHEVLGILNQARKKGLLNNDNIPLMVEGYFFEMNLVIHELARVLAPGGRVVMVNDNVQYHGEEVPVDLILSDFAQSAGLATDRIWVLPRGKGNSSQQMGSRGRNEIRKCVYVWSKPPVEPSAENS